MKLIEKSTLSLIVGGIAAIRDGMIIVSNESQVTLDQDNVKFTPYGICIQGELIDSVFENSLTIDLKYSYSLLERLHIVSGFRLNENTALYMY